MAKSPISNFFFKWHWNTHLYNFRFAISNLDINFRTIMVCRRFEIPITEWEEDRLMLHRVRTKWHMPMISSSPYLNYITQVELFLRILKNVHIFSIFLIFYNISKFLLFLNLEYFSYCFYNFIFFSISEFIIKLKNDGIW